MGWGVTDAIRVRSCDHRPRPKSCLAYSGPRMLHDELSFYCLQVSFYRTLETLEGKDLPIQWVKGFISYWKTLLII